MSIRLDINAVAQGAFLVPWRNRAAFGRALAAPFALGLVFIIAWHYGQGPPPRYWILLLSPFYLGLYCWFAVTCHRLVLLGPVNIDPRMIPPWTRRETRFLLWLIALALIAAVPVLIASPLLFLVQVAGSATIKDLVPARLFRFLIEIPVWYIGARFCLIFPATAIDKKPTLEWAWEASRNNGWRLVFVVGLLPFLLHSALGLLSRDDPSIAETALLSLLHFAVIAVLVTALSLSYRELTRDEVVSPV
jgi:hypothetical protein